MKKPIITLTSILTLVLITTIGYAQNNRPQTGKQSIEQLKGSPAGSNVIAVINAINGEGEEVNEAFVKKYFSPDNISRNGVERLQTIVRTDIARNDGKVTVYEADRKSIFEYVLLVKGSVEGKWMEFIFKIEQSQPYRIDSLMIRAGLSEPTAEMTPMNFN